MDSDTQQLESIRSQALSQLEQLTASPKPTYWVDGQRVHWEEYVAMLQSTIDWCDRKLACLSPFEVRSEGSS